MLINLRLLGINYLLILNLVAQIPINLLPNSSFEFGNGSPGTSMNFGLIWNWQKANNSNYISWRDPDYYDNGILGYDSRDKPEPIPNRIVEIGVGQGLRVNLINNLVRNKIYFLRTKIIIPLARNEEYMLVHFSNDATWNTISYMNAAVIGGGGTNYLSLNGAIITSNYYRWHVLETMFKVPDDPSHDNLSNMILLNWFETTSVRNKF